MTRKNLQWRALRSILALPVVALLVIPSIILWLTKSVQPGWGLPKRKAWLPTAAGAALVGVGLSLMAATIRLFTRVGEGTLAPWDPPQKLVVAGPYRRVRNPMHSGVFLVLYGEGLILGSLPILLFVTAVFIFHWIYIPLTEERWLANKFGEDYTVYKRNVPRWIPRLTPWENEAEA